jgi:hypothetical protein
VGSTFLVAGSLKRLLPLAKKTEVELSQRLGYESRVEIEKISDANSQVSKNTREA